VSRSWPSAVPASPKGGRPQLLLFGASGLERLALARPGCGINPFGGSKSELRPPEMRGLRVCIRVARCYARAAHPRSFRPDARVRGEQ
jgi:hypothetical protein